MEEEKEPTEEERREILGETEESEEGETSGEEEAETEGEEEAEEGVEEEEEDKDKGPVPYSRFKQVHTEAQEVPGLKEKLDLLKTDPEEYYKQYPEERPEQSVSEQPSKQDEIWDRIIKGGPHDGEKLGDVFDQGGPDARYAMQLFNEQVDADRTETKAAKDKEDQFQAEADTELKTFRGSLAKDIHDKDYGSLSVDEKGAINQVIDETLAWMRETGKGFANIIDAYFLKNKETLLAGEQAKGISSLIKSSQTGVTSIANKKDVSTKLTGYESDMGKSADDIAAKIESMTDPEATKYLANAPAKLREKYPSVPWG